MECSGTSSDVIARALVATGSYPRITVSHDGHQIHDLQFHTWSDYVFDGAIVDMDDACDVELCSPMWLAPLPTTGQCLVLHVKVETVGMETEVFNARFVFCDQFTYTIDQLLFY